MSFPAHVLPIRRPWLVAMHIATATPRRSRDRGPLVPMPLHWLREAKPGLWERFKAKFIITDGVTE